MSAQHVFRRTLTIDPREAHDIITTGVPTIKDCTIVEYGPSLVIDRKRRIMANRNHMVATITYEGQKLTITVDGNGTMQGRFAGEIFDLLPTGAVYDHGLQAAQDAMSKSERWFSSMELTNLGNDLRDGEEVIMLASGQVDGKVALIVVTDKRIITKDKGAFDSASREILPKHVTSITSGQKITGEWITLTVSSESVTFTAMQPGRGAQIAEHIRTLRDAGDAPAAAPAGPGVADLAKLAELHTAGILTDDEFTAAKAKALGL